MALQGHLGRLTLSRITNFCPIRSGRTSTTKKAKGSASGRTRWTKHLGLVNPTPPPNPAANTETL